MNVAIIKYNAGNIFSVDYALKRIGVTPVITSDKETLLKADKVIFPGVGEAETTMRYLKEQNLDTLIKNLKQPVLGICLGMQLMCKYSEEGNTDCLGIFEGRVRKLTPPREFKVPHMGWDNVDFTRGHADYMLEGINPSDQFYFVHSYYLDTKDRNLIFKCLCLNNFIIFI